MQLFADDCEASHEPDMQCAGFKALVGPHGSGLEGKALVQVKLGGGGEAPCLRASLCIVLQHGSH